MVGHHLDNSIRPTIRLHAKGDIFSLLLTPDLSLDEHVTAVSAKCFFQLRQLRRIRRSLDDNSAATLVHAFVASRVDYCGSLLIGAPKKTTDKLQRVLNAAVRIVSNTRKYDRGLRQFRQHELHWLDAVDRVRFSVCPGVQVSTQHGTWIPVGTLPTCVRRSWSPSPTLSWSW